MIKVIKKLRRDSGGIVSIEYGLFIAMISIAAIVALEALGTSFRLIFQIFFG